LGDTTKNQPATIAPTARTITITMRSRAVTGSLRWC
jgi:hypothetical protein